MILVFDGLSCSCRRGRGCGHERGRGREQRRRATLRHANSLSNLGRSRERVIGEFEGDVTRHFSLNCTGNISVTTKRNMPKEPRDACGSESFILTPIR